MSIREKQNNKNILKNINLLEATTNNNKYINDFDDINNKSIDYINHNNKLTELTIV